MQPTISTIEAKISAIYSTVKLPKNIRSNTIHVSSWNINTNGKNGKTEHVSACDVINSNCLGQCMGARLNNKSLGRSKSARKHISDILMNEYGKKKLQKCAGNKEELHSLFGAQNLKKTNHQKGTFKVYNNVKHKAKGKKIILMKMVHLDM